MIIELGETLVSGEIFTNKFVCDLEKCKGACCVEGDRGAPIEPGEIAEIEKHLPVIRKYMTPEGLELLASEGFHEGSEIDDPATTCLPTGECVFAYREQGILGCAIEKAHLAGEIDYPKPISCHLYPIRVGKAGGMETLNYSRWNICSDACHFGEKLNVPLFRFLKPPLIRKYGEDWYRELELVYDEYIRQYPESK